MSHNMIFY